MPTNPENPPTTHGEDYGLYRSILEVGTMAIIPSGAAIWELASMTAEGSTPSILLKALGGFTIFAGAALDGLALFGATAQSWYPFDSSGQQG